MKTTIFIFIFFFISFINCYGQTANEYIKSGRIKYYPNEDYQGAIDDFNKAIELDSTNAKAYYYRGRAKRLIHNNQNYQREAILDYNKAIELNPKFEEAYNWRGIEYLFMYSKPSKAIEDFSKIIALNPKNAEAYYYRGCAKNILGQKDKACIDFKKALGLGYKNAIEAIKDNCH